MNIKDLISDSAKATINKSVQIVIEEPRLFDDFLEFALREIPQYSQRASRVVYYTLERDISFVKPHLNNLVSKLAELKNDSIRGTFIGIFAKLILPEEGEKLAELADHCFKFINTPSESESQKVYSLEVLYKISKIYPEIKNELSLNIEKLFPYSKIAFQSRSRRILKALYKEMNLDIEVPDFYREGFKF